MCSTAMKRTVFNVAAKADAERYRRYAEAKRKIPHNITPAEYEAAIAKLAKRYHI